MTFNRVVPMSVLVLAAACLTLACNTIKASGVSKKGATADPGGVTIQSKIDDGKGSNSTTPGTDQTAKPPTGTAGEQAQTADAAVAADCYKSNASICKIEAEILRLTNEERARKSRGALKLAPRLSWVAREWSFTQGKRRSISHDGFPGQRESLFTREFNGSQAEIMAENVAMTGAGSESDIAQQFYDMWRRSPGHYANMIGNYAAMGIGVAEGNDGWYATEIFGDE